MFHLVKIVYFLRVAIKKAIGFFFKGANTLKERTYPTKTTRLC